MTTKNLKDNNDFGNIPNKLKHKSTTFAPVHGHYLNIQEDKQSSNIIVMQSMTKKQVIFHKLEPALTSKSLFLANG